MAICSGLHPPESLGGRDERRKRRSADTSPVSYFNMRKILAVLLMSVGLSAQVATAQQAPPADTSEPWYSGLSIGLRTGFRFLDPIGDLDATISSATTDPPQTAAIASKSATKRVPIGPTFHLQLSDRWGLTVDALFSRAGYDASSRSETQPEGEEDPVFISALYERTRANYWDFPVLARYYYTGFQDDPARLYLTGGVALRTVSGVRTFSELDVDEDDDLTDTSRAPVKPANSAVAGAVVGGGLRLQDEVGLKIDLEVRYTRWFQRVFDSSVARSSANEGTVFVSFSF